MTTWAVVRQRAAVRDALAVVLPQVQALDPSLGTRLQQRLSNRLHLQLERLDNPSPSILSEGDDLLREVFAFLAGASARACRVDDGLCLLAERWLDELSRVGDLRPVGVVVPSNIDELATLVQVIRLRWPTDGLWGLPVAAHEYGHFVAYELAVARRKEGLPDMTHPVLTALQELAGPAELPGLFTFGHELFADAFATYVAGPAFGFACAWLRFDPATANRSVGQHPTSAQRMFVITSVLRRMADSQPGQGWMSAAVDRLDGAWAPAVEKTGVPPDPLSPDGARLLEDFWKLLDSDAHTRALRYGTFDDAVLLGKRLPAPPARPPSIADVLNGLWWRWTSGAPGEMQPPAGKDADALAAAARSLCEDPG